MWLAKKLPVAMLCLLTCLLPVSCVNTDRGPASIVSLQETDLDEPPQTTVWVKTLVRDLEEPWGMDFLPDGAILITEKGGELKEVSPRGFKVRNVAGVPESVEAGQGGLLVVLVHPDFSSNGFVYLSYVVEENKLYSTRIIRARLENHRLVDHEVLITAQPFFAERRHFGSRLLIDNGFLYITIGDRGNRDLAQSLETHNGKVLRLRDDGTVPGDNPFVGREGARPEIWTYGHRNPQGIATHPHTGAIWVSEHGPQGGDEINALVRGANYGWPVISYGEEYGGGKIGIGTHHPDMEQPLTYYVPSIGTAGIDFYVGDTYPNWKASLLIAGLRRPQINKVELAGDGLGGKSRMLANLEMRIRDVQVGPDGLIYALADGSRLIRFQLDR